MAMNLTEHQAILDELRGADETRRTELIVTLTENYTEAETNRENLEKNVTDLEAKNNKYLQQNNELFLAATAHARDKQNNETKTESTADKKSSEFLGGMFDNRGNLIPAKS